MSTSLRKRRRGEDKNDNDDDDEMEIFVRQFNRAAGRGGRGIWTLCGASLLLIFAIFAASSISKWRSKRVSSSLTRKDLKILSVYPRSVSSRIAQISGQTEVLVTEDNREAVEAIRTSIGMANNLRYDAKTKIRRRKKGGIAGVLLEISNFISNLRSGPRQKDRRGFVQGEIVLESFDAVKMRSYLEMHGKQCSNNNLHEHVRGGDAGYWAENTVLLRYENLITSMSTADGYELLDALWNHALQLFTWCQFANGDARGYFAHGTSVAGADTSFQEMLEEARLSGVGITVKSSHDISQPMGNNNVHGVPFFIIPFGAASMDLSKQILYSLFSEETSSIVPVTSKSLLFEINDMWLQKWNSMQGEAMGQTRNLNELGESHISALGKEDGNWLFLKSIVREISVASDVRWLARYCHGESCTTVMERNEYY